MLCQVPRSKHERFHVTFGANRSVIFDLQTGAAFHLNNAATIELQNVMNNQPSKNQHTDFYTELLKSGIIGEQYELNKELIDFGPIPERPIKKIWIELTNQCNQQCVHCYASSTPKSGQGLTTDEIRNFLKNVVRVGCDVMQFTGGEPLLRNDLPLFCEIAQDGNVREIEVFSNLSIDNKKILRNLTKHNVIFNTTILAPNAERHDQLTQCPGAFNRMISNITYLHSLGITVNASIILTAETEDSCDEIIDLCNRLGLQYGEPDPVRPFGRGIDNSIRCNRSHNIKTEPNFTVSPRSFLYAKQFNPCWGNMLFLRYDGIVAQCPHAREFEFGNILKDSIDTIIINALSAAWTLTMDMVSVCKDCEFRYMCNDCRPLAYEGVQEKLYGKNKKCLYDPYSGTWSKPQLSAFDDSNK